MKPYLFLFVSVIMTASSFAEDVKEPEFLDVQATLAQRRYNLALVKATKEFERQATEALKAYIAALANVKDSATKAGRLDAAVQIRDEIVRLEGGVQAKPTNAPERETVVWTEGKYVWQWRPNEQFSFTLKNGKVQQQHNQEWSTLSSMENNCIQFVFKNPGNETYTMRLTPTSIAGKHLMELWRGTTAEGEPKLYGTCVKVE